MYDRIIVPLDGSKLAECVIPHVEALGKGCGVKDVVLVRVIEAAEMPPDTYLVFTADELNRMEAGRRSEAEKYLRKMASQLQKSGLAARAEVLEGKPAESIADYAKNKEVGLIIIATHGRSGISRWYWGSVADRILQSACVPVLMVRAPGCIPGI